MTSSSLAQVTDLRLQEGPRPLELREIAPPQRDDCLPRPVRQLGPVEVPQLLLDLAQLVRHAIQRAHVGGVEDGQQHVDASGGGHGQTVSAAARTVKASARAGYTVLPAVAAGGTRP